MSQLAAAIVVFVSSLIAAATLFVSVMMLFPSLDPGEVSKLLVRYVTSQM